MIARSMFLHAAMITTVLITFLQAAQPRVGQSEGEPRWAEILKRQWGLDIDKDLRNPLVEGVSPAGLFVKADKARPVAFTPLMAWGMEAPTHGGWYPGGPKAGDLPAAGLTARKELWTYAFKQPGEQAESFAFTPPPLKSGAASFDPGDKPFGLWVANDTFKDEGVYTQPAMVAAVNARLRVQPYKAMIYPNRDAKSGKFVRDSYIIGFEYSTNDDCQDVVARVDNVRLISPDPRLKGVLAPDVAVRKLAGGFKFTEGPAWNPGAATLYFSDIPDAHIVAYADAKARVANSESNGSNGLMMDRQGDLVRCEHKGRRVSRGPVGETGTTIVDRFEGRRLNSPNDLWLDPAGGIYFTDPRYGGQSDRELEKEAVYYVTKDAKLTCVINDLVKPNGIAITPDGRHLLVLDNGADAVYRYEIAAPGRLAKPERIASVDHPDGMTVDAEGRMYIACCGGVWVLDASGKWLGIIETPEWPANCTFGGKDWSTLFITARTSLYGIETTTRGWHVHLDGEAPRAR